MSRPRSVIVKGAAQATLLLLLVAAGCAAPAPTPTPTATPIPPTPTATATPSPTPPATPTTVPLSEARILTIATWADPPHYDVHQSFSPALHRIGPGLVYSRMLRFRSDEEAGTFSLQLECDLCESWEQVDPVTYRFALKREVRWQDIPPVNGRELTADDIIYSYQRQATPGWDNASLLQNLQSFNKVDTYTLEIKTRTPDADFLVSLADGHSKIVAREAVEESGDLREGPTIGTGPWQWEGGTKGVEYLLTRNPFYYEEGLPRADRLRIQVIPDLQTRFSSLVVGNLDVAEVPPSEVASLGERYPRLGLLEVRHYGQGTEMVLNTRVSPFQDVRVRRAFFQALDPWRYPEEVGDGGSFTGLGMPLVSKEWLLPQEELRSYWGDPEQGRDLLSQAGVRPAVVMTVADYGDASLALARQVAGDLQAVGIDPQMHIVTPVEYVERVWGEGQYALYLGPLAPMTTPNDYFLGVLHSQGSANTTGYQDTELDQLLEAQADVTDPFIRRELVRQVQRRALQDAVRFMVATQGSYWAWQPRVEGFHPNLAGYEYFYYARISVPKP